MLEMPLLCKLVAHYASFADYTDASVFSERILLHDTDEGTKEYEITGGVPQGSVLGPLLWNILYDGMLRLLSVQIIGDADDIAVPIVAKEIHQTEATCMTTNAGLSQRILN